MRHLTRSVRLMGIALLLALIAMGSFHGAFAQDATPAADAGHPGHIHSGNCQDGGLGDVIQPLANAVEPEGDAVGQSGGVSTAMSMSNVPMTLDDILADDHAINFHLSTEEIGTYIACGEVGGVLDANGALTVGLREVKGSGYAGIAYLAPGADGTSTDVSVFLAEGLMGGADEAAAAPASGDAVKVTLSEFKIDMPTTLPAGSTTFEVSNTGEFPHNMDIEGEGVDEKLAENLEGGQSGTLTVDLKPGTYTVYCPVGSHREKGMELELTVE